MKSQVSTKLSGMALYRRFCCAFVRTKDWGLLSCTGPLEQSVRIHWGLVSLAVESSAVQQNLVLPGQLDQAKEADHERALTRKTRLQVDTIQKEALSLYECPESGHLGTVSGLIVQEPPPTDMAFDDVFAWLLLRNIKLFTSPPPPLPESQSSSLDIGFHATTGRIIDIFEDRLRYVADNDKWNSGGRTYFFSRVHNFVQRWEQVEFCLPAFPCKSSNPDKVYGVLPDRGEQLALEHLHSFVQAIEAVYPPGAKLWIISDGHVFSDCSELVHFITPLHCHSPRRERLPSLTCC
jgi:hypothetical protein